MRLKLWEKNSLNYDDEIHHTVNSYIIPNGGHFFPFFSFPYELWTHLSYDSPEVKVRQKNLDPTIDRPKLAIMI